MAKLFGRIFPKPLKNKREQLLRVPQQDRAHVAFAERPPEPIIEVNERFCVVNHNAAALRNLFLIPWLLGLSLTGYWHVDEFMREWQQAERATKREIETAKQEYGKDFFETTQDPIKIRTYNLINKHGKMTFKKFLDLRHNTKGYGYVADGPEYYIDLFLVALYGLGIPGLLIWSIRFPRLAPLVFDRDTRLVSSWRRGWTWVQRYDDIRILETMQALTFSLRAEAKDGSVGWAKFLVQPSGNPAMNSLASYQPLLAFIVQFMEYGKEHVMKGQKNFKINPHFYFFTDKKPQNFDAKVEELLQRIAQNDDEPPLDEYGNPIPIDLKALAARKKKEGEAYRKQRSIKSGA